MWISGWTNPNPALKVFLWSERKLKNLEEPHTNAAKNETMQGFTHSSFHPSIHQRNQNRNLRAVSQPDNPLVLPWQPWYKPATTFMLHELICIRQLERPPSDSEWHTFLCWRKDVLYHRNPWALTRAQRKRGTKCWQSYKTQTKVSVNVFSPGASSEPGAWKE